MWDLTIQYNGSTYIVNYNEQSGYYEIELTAPQSRWNIPNTNNIQRYIWRRIHRHIQFTSFSKRANRPGHRQSIYVDF
jgi:hypothetical protein